MAGGRHGPRRLRLGPARRTGCSRSRGSSRRARSRSARVTAAYASSTLASNSVSVSRPSPVCLASWAATASRSAWDTRIEPAGVAAVESVVRRIVDLAGPPEPPARLHGDLWAGNIVWTAERHAVLVDPAAHGGHRETDLAMLGLFGLPQLARVQAAYHEVHPLADGWQERQPLHQLFPLLVHAALFGGGYPASVERTAAAL